MTPEIVIHKNTSDYVYPMERNRLVFRLKVQQGQIESVTLHYFSRTNPEEVKQCKMERIAVDGAMETYECSVLFSKVARYQKYFFLLETKDGERIYYTSTGLAKEKPKVDFFEFLYANPGDCIRVPEWAKGCVYYQIFPERFCNGDSSNDPKEVLSWGTLPTRDNYLGGDLKGIRKNIPYLKELGIDCIYLNPIFLADFNHKYATTDYYKVDPIFGTNEEFESLVKELHEAGIRILLDGVFNHVGIHFKQFEDAFANGKKSKYYDWFFFTSDAPQISHHDYECVGAYKYMPKLNTSNPEVREFVLDVMEYWIREYDIDGWRLDVADEVDGNLWIEARYRLKAKYPDCLLLGETWGEGGNLLDGKRMDSVMNYCFRDAVRDFVAWETIDANTFGQRLGHMFSSNRTITNHCLYNLLDSHDTPRFLFFSKEEKRKLKMAVAMQMFYPGAPAIYYGDEVGMTGDNDPDCRRAMEWGDAADKELYSYYRSLIAFRKRHTSLAEGRFETESLSKDIFLITRQDEKERCTCLIHRSKAETMVNVNSLPGGKKYYVEANGDLTEMEEKEEILLKPFAVIVINQKEEI